MNSFQQLNQYGANTVNFASQADYSIVFGNSLGNGTVTSNVNVYHTLLNQQPILVFDQPLLPLTVAIQSPVDSEGVALSNVVYSGPNGNITVTHPDTLNWLAGNIWTVADYDEFFANSQAYITSTRTLDFVYQTSITDQLGNVRNFSTAVDVVPFGFSYPGSVTFNEDSNVDITGLVISDLANYDYDVTFQLTTAAAGNLVLLSNAWSNTTITVSGDRSTINPILAGNLRYVPTDDWTTTSNVAVTVYNSTLANTLVAGNIVLNIGATHDEYQVPAINILFNRVANAGVGTSTSGNIRITDQAVNRQYLSNVAISNTAGGNLYIASTSYGNLVSLSGNINQVNANLANIIFVPSGSAVSNITLTYTQIQTTANIVQANAVPITMEYQPLAVHVNSGIEKDIANGTLGSNDFAVGQGNVTQTEVGPPPYYSYIDYTGNLTPVSSTTLFRDTANVKYGASAIKIPDTAPNVSGYGIYGNTDSALTSAASSTLAFWIYPHRSHAYSRIARISTSTGEKYFIDTWNGSMYIIPDTPGLVRDYASTFFETRIGLGTLVANTWTHVAMARSGSNEWYAWVNGVPSTDYRGGGNPASPLGPLQSATTWSGATGAGAFQKIEFGAPLTVPATGDPYPGYRSGGNQVKLACSLEDIILTNDLHYTPLTSFTPVSESYGGNVRQYWSGV